MGLVLTIAIIGCIIQGIFIYSEYVDKYVPAVILKGSASLMFVIIGALGLISCEDKSFGKLIVIGLIFGMIGDILLNLRYLLEKIGQKIFLMGILAFLIGHVLYLCALIPKSKALLICVSLGIVLAAITLIIIFKTIDEVKIAFKIFGVFYVGAVIVMTTIAIGNMITSGFELSAVVYAVGALAFMSSDIILIFNTFCGTSKFSLRLTNLAMYYLGQILIAMSLMWVK